MVAKENIIFNKRIYYTPSWTGVAKISILAVYHNGKLLVQAKNSPFVRTDDYVFDDPKKARKALPQWQHDDKKRRMLKKKKRGTKAKHNKTGC